MKRDRSPLEGWNPEFDSPRCFLDLSGEEPVIHELRKDTEPSNPREDYCTLSRIVLWNDLLMDPPDGHRSIPADDVEALANGDGVLIPLRVHADWIPTLEVVSSEACGTPVKLDDHDSIDGVMYVTREQIESEYVAFGFEYPLAVEKARTYILGELEEFNRYLKGGIIEHVAYDMDGDELEPCLHDYLNGTPRDAEQEWQLDKMVRLGSFTNIHECLSACASEREIRSVLMGAGFVTARDVREGFDCPGPFRNGILSYDDSPSSGIGILCNGEPVLTVFEGEGTFLECLNASRESEIHSAVAERLCEMSKGTKEERERFGFVTGALLGDERAVVPVR